VLRRLDAVLEATKNAVLKHKKFLDTLKVAEQDGALRLAAGQAFYNVSEFTLAKLKASAAGQRLRDDFIAYLDGFSPNVQEILTKFNFRNQIQKLVDSHVLGYLIDDFLDPEVNLAPLPVKDADGRIKLPALDNHGMGTVFEELSPCTCIQQASCARTRETKHEALRYQRIGPGASDRASPAGH